MTSDGNIIINYFPDNQLTKLVQFIYNKGKSEQEFEGTLYSGAICMEFVYPAYHIAMPLFALYLGGPCVIM